MDSDFLNYTPVRNCEFETNGDLVTVTYYKEKKTFIEKIFMKNISPKPNKIDFDEIGSFVWNLCENKNDVKKIIELTEKKFNTTEDKISERVELFLNQLSKNKLITFYTKKTEAHD